MRLSICKLFPFLFCFLFFSSSFSQICQIEVRTKTSGGSCLDLKQNQTLVVDNTTLFLGGNIGFCPQVKSPGGPTQTVIVFEKSGRMAVTDPAMRVKDVCTTFVNKIVLKDSTSKIALVPFSAPAELPSPINFLPLNVSGIKSTINNTVRDLSYSGNTYYGWALGNARTFLKLLPNADTSRNVIFLSDGTPYGADSVDRGKEYRDSLTAGILNYFSTSKVRIFTIYFHADAGTAAARDTLTHMAQITGGKFYDVANAAALQGVFDSILVKIQPTPVLQYHYQIANVSTGQSVQGAVLDSSVTNFIVKFPLLRLQGGANLLKIFNLKSGAKGANDTAELKQITLNRKAGGLTAAEQAVQDSFFTKTCTNSSITRFTNNSFTVMAPGAAYDANYDSLYILNTRGWPNSALQKCTVEVCTASGDSEMFPITETSLTSNIYHGTKFLQLINGLPEKLNGQLQVHTFDTLYVTYRNTDFYVDGVYWDVSRDTIAGKGLAIKDVVPPTVFVTAPNAGEKWPVVSKRRITWTAVDNTGITFISLYWKTPEAAWTKIDSLPAGNGNGSYLWTVPSQPVAVAWIKVNAYDARGNHSSDTSDLPFSIQNIPSFTSADSITVAAGTEMNYTVTCYLPIGGSPAIDPLPGNPKWLNMSPVAITGKAPDGPRVDTFKVALSVGKIVYDTLKLKIYIGGPSLILPIANIQKNFALAAQNQKIIAFIDRPGTLKFNAYDIRGAQIMNFNRGVEAGNYSISFNPKSGIYLIKLEHEGRKLVKRFLVMR
jgi:hypothetical protein